MDAAAWTVIGVAVGAVAGGATSLLSPLVLWKTEQKKLKVEHDNAKDRLGMEQQHELARIAAANANTNANAERERKRTQVEEWRVEVSLLAQSYFHSANLGDLSIPPPPSPVGSAWFEALRPHLDMSNSAVWLVAERGEPLNRDTFPALFSELSRIEEDWGLA